MPSLVATVGPKAGARFLIGAGLSIGRSPSSDVQLLEDSKVSRHHARLLIRGGACYVADLASRNGTLVNGEAVAGEVPLQPGDRVQVGDTVFVFDPPVRATVSDAEAAILRGGAVEEFLPATGPAGALFRAAMSIVASPSEAAVLRRGAEEALRILSADVAAALVPGSEGLTTAAVVGALEVHVPRALMRVALESKEAARTARAAVAPISAGGPPFGLLYLERSGGLDEEELGLLGALGRLCGEAAASMRSRSQRAARGPMVGSSTVFRRAADQIRRAAVRDQTTILIGEPGTGKGMLAGWVHERSSRALGPLIVADCREPPAVLDEMLFTRKQGGLTASAFARADGGTLLLRGVDALTRESGAKVARVIRERRAPMPGGGMAPSDFRVIVTTREPLSRLVSLGKADPELAMALEGIEVRVPPLRERRSDIPLLFEHLAAQSARRLQARPPRLSSEAREALVEYAWPGNVHELQVCVARLTLSCPGEEVLGVHLPREIGGGGVALQGDQRLGDLVAKLERDVITQALRRARGKKVKVAELLGISRPTLDKKIALYKLTVK